MNLKKKDVAVELRTVIDDDGEKELSIVKQIGTYVKRGQIEVIVFNENSTDFGKVNNLITIQPDKINIKRSGSIKMNQQFLEGKKTECLYRYPYGSFFMEITTMSISHQPLQNDRKGEVTIQYEAKLNDEQKRYHHLTLTYMEERK